MTATEVFHAAMVNEAGSFARLFAAEFAGPFALDPDDTVAVAGKATPRLSNGGKVLNLDTATVDRYLAQTGVVATIFAADGDEFVRISTSLKKQDGTRAIGTQLDHDHPAMRPCARASASSAWQPYLASNTLPSTTPCATRPARWWACSSSASISARIWPC
jgi:methyl-accepting chemotaxis protein-2 (aspartate sensor receptor)